MSNNTSEGAPDAPEQPLGPFELRKLDIEEGTPLQYFLRVSAEPDAPPIHLNALLGARLSLSFTGDIRCQACGTGTRKSYGQGHCYRCFKRLARCDLCVMAPHRCHYDQGTCREPEWGESFCMQPHLVYLANSSGLKVGITRDGGHLGRWRDQGALQGRLIARSTTRQAAGELEAQLAKTFSDRSQWRALVSSDAEPVDLDAAAAQARALVPDPGAQVQWIDGDDSDDQTQSTHHLRYPVTQWPPVARLNFKKSDTVEGLLLGIKGQYLLFDTGVFNVREHTGYETVLNWRPGEGPAVAESASQIDLF